MDQPSARRAQLPFKEQIEYFRDKVKLPTRSWTEIWEGAHSRAFVVAGATKEGLLTDLHEAVRSAIEDGTTLAEFRGKFDAAVAKYGWEYNGGRNWRTRVIYETNLRTSYMAGRYQQMQAVKESRPFWRYRHSPYVKHPRADHKAWDGLVLHADDPWWNTHYPPNGWGCQCGVDTLSQRDLDKTGKDGPDEAPAIKYETVTVGERGPTPRTVQVPEGIDPGFGYNVGRTAWGKPLADAAMQEWQKEGSAAWQALTTTTWKTLGLPERLASTGELALGPRAKDASHLAPMVAEVIGGAEKTFEAGGVPVTVNAQTLATHIDPERAEYLPALRAVLEKPQEVWLSFEQHKGTGKVVLRARILRVMTMGKKRALLFVANARGGMLEGWTFVPVRNADYLNRQRVGDLLFAEELGPSLPTRGAGGPADLSERAPDQGPDDVANLP